jgi:hypothetical protein
MSSQFLRDLGHDTCIRRECSIEIEASHPALISQPDAITNLVLEALAV